MTMLWIEQKSVLAIITMLMCFILSTSETITRDDREENMPNPMEQMESVKEGQGNFFEAFTASFTAITLAETGDKTFWIAAIMSLTHPRIIVALGAILCLSIMTFISCGFGLIIHLIPMIYTYYIATALFFIFGVKMVFDACRMKPTAVQDQMDEVETDLRKRDDKFDRDVQSMVDGRRSRIRKTKTYLKLRIFAQAFVMTFLSEWGDRSQFTTVAMAASKNIYGVIVGSVLAHIICTILAVIGGRLVAYKISVRIVTLIGGFVFIGFAFYGVILPPDELQS